VVLFYYLFFSFSILWCSWSGDHPWEDLAKSGYLFFKIKKLKKSEHPFIYLDTYQLFGNRLLYITLVLNFLKKSNNCLETWLFTFGFFLESWQFIQVNFWTYPVQTQTIGSFILHRIQWKSFTLDNHGYIYINIFKKKFNFFEMGIWCLIISVIPIPGPATMLAPGGQRGREFLILAPHGYGIQTAAS